MDMANPSVEEIVSAIDKKSLLELRDLAERFQEKFAVTAEPPKAHPEVEDSYWTPYYTLKIVRLDCLPENKLRLIKLLRDLSGCSLKDAKTVVDNPEANLPMNVANLFHMHPSECEKELRPVREELESLGAVLESDYNYGYFD